MLEQAIVISLIITSVHVSMWEGMIFDNLAHRLGAWLDRHRLSILRKPLFECNICMGGIYTLVIYPILYGLAWRILPVMLMVIGCNVIMAAIIKYIQND